MSTEQHADARSLKGRLLVASPHADGTPYRRAAVLLVEHSEQGAAGVVIDGTFRASLDQLRHAAPRSAGFEGGSARLAGLPVRVAQWEPGQLDLEVQQGIWLHTPADPGLVFSDHVPAWSELVRHIGRTVYRETLGIRAFPADPSLN